MRLFFKYLLLLLLSFISYIAVCQNDDLDSLKKDLTISRNDTNKIFLLNKIARQYFFTGEYDSSIFYARKIKSLTELILSQNSKSDMISITCQKGLGLYHNVTGLNQYSMGDYDNALKHYNSFLEISQKNNDKKGEASAYGNIGNMYYEQGRYPESLELYLKTLKIREAIQDKKGIANSYISLGNVHEMLSNNWTSLSYYKKALKVFIEFDDKYSVAGTYSNIAGVYSHQGYKYLALKMYQEYMALMIEFNDQQSIAVTHGNIGYIYNDQKRYPEALIRFQKALDIQEQINDIPGISSSYLSIGDVYLRMNDYKKSEVYLLKGFESAKQLNELELLRQSYAGLYTLYSKTKEYKKSLTYFKTFIIYRDSITNKENTERATRLELNFEFERKKATSNLLQLKKEAIAQTQRTQQQVIIWCVCGVLLIVVGFLVFIYRSFLQKQKANLELTEQKHIIEEKQKEILDSIYYAKRIQTALITSEHYINKSLNRLNR